MCVDPAAHQTLRQRLVSVGDTGFGAPGSRSGGKSTPGRPSSGRFNYERGSRGTRGSHVPQVDERGLRDDVDQVPRGVSSMRYFRVPGLHLQGLYPRSLLLSVRPGTPVYPCHSFGNCATRHSGCILGTPLRSEKKGSIPFPFDSESLCSLDDPKSSDWVVPGVLRSVGGVGVKGRGPTSV